MNEKLAYRRARDIQGAACSTPGDLSRYLAQIRMDAHSLRIGLAQAVMHMYAGAPLPDKGTAELPYPQDVVERKLLDDVMRGPAPDRGPGGLVHDPALANALRHALRLLEDAVDAANIVNDLLLLLPPRARSGCVEQETAMSPG
ncbi:hypothetical protein ACWCWD_28955 [Streptomyces sp. NPDC001493]